MKTLETFDFGRSIGRSQYDWDTILNGKINVLEAGEDFNCKASTLKTRIRAVAKDMGLGARTSTDKDGNIVVQSYKPTAEEVEFAKTKSADRAANRAAKKAAKGDEKEPEAEAQEAPARNRRRAS